MPTGKSTSNTNTPSNAGGTNTGSSNRGFAAMDENKQREIASQGGKAVPKTMNNLHDTIDNVAEKAKPAIDRLAQNAHRNVERLAFRGAQLEDAYRRYLVNSKTIYKAVH